jgi:hypothetical protein
MEYFGKVARCKAGKIGVIVGKGKLNEYVATGKLNELELRPIEFYIGVSLDGSKWQSKDPEILADNINNYFITIEEKE